MDEIFGLSMTTIMLVLVAAFGLCLGIGVAIALRNPVIFRIGVRNVPRRPAQTTLIVVGMMLSTLIIAAALTTGDTLNRSITSAVYELNGHTDELVVNATGDPEIAGPRAGGTIPEQAAADLEARVVGHDKIDGILPVLAESVPVVNSRTNLSEPQLIATGLDPARVGAFDLTDQDGTPIDFPALAADEIVLGATPAENLDARVGDTLQIYVRNQPRELRVAAIAPDSLLTGMQTPGAPGGFALQLDPAQALLDQPDEISFIAISNQGAARDSVAHSDAVVEAVTAALDGTALQVIPVKQSGLEQAEDAGSAFTTAFLVLGLFSIAAGILLIFLIFVLLAAERTPELGIARAVGMKRRHLTQMFLAEGLAYNLISALVGAALGVGVAFLIAGAMGQLVGEIASIRPTATPRSLIVAYTCGVVVTFITLVISSWRVSRLNIVTAIRDVPESNKVRESRRWLILGLVGIVAGVLLTLLGTTIDHLLPFTLGLSLPPLGLAMVLRTIGVPARPLYSVAALLVLALWLTVSRWAEDLVGTLDSGPEMFFPSGVMMVASATIAIVWNAEILTDFVGVLGRTFSRWLPAVRTAVAYPLARKGRTGLTIAMFALIVFSLVMIATVSASFGALFTSDVADAGWDIQASQAPNNPIPELTTALDDADVDTDQITATGRLETVLAFRTHIRNAGDAEWARYTVNGGNARFFENGEMPLQIRASGYGNDTAVWEAMRDHPNLAVVDAAAIIADDFEDGATSNFKVAGVSEGNSTMDPIEIEIADPSTGKRRTVTVIGVLDSRVSILSGIFLNEQAFRDVFAQPDSITHYVGVELGVNAVEYAKEIESGLITFGVQANSIQQVIEQRTAQAEGFLYLIKGFMGLGLLVGIAALGVVSFRSVVERRQQIGMLRAIGYQRGMVAASFLIESMMVTLLGVGAGALLGLVLARQLLTGGEIPGTANAAFIVPWLELLVIVTTAFGASLLMAYIPARQAARVPIAEALRYE